MPLWTPPPFPYTVELSARTGVTITGAGTAHVKGTWTSVIAATAKDAYGFWTSVAGANVAAAVTAQLIDFGVGPTDPPEIIINNLNAGATETNSTGGAGFGRVHYWPCFIPAGSKIWARNQGLIVSDTSLIHVSLNTEMPYGAHIMENVTTYGAVTASSRGTPVTSGAAAYGSAVRLTNTATTRDHRAWHVSIGQNADTTVVQQFGLQVQLLIGSGSTGPIGPWLWGASATEILNGPFPPIPIYQPVPVGAEIWCRVLAGATSDSYDVICYGLD